MKLKSIKLLAPVHLCATESKTWEASETLSIELENGFISLVISGSVLMTPVSNMLSCVPVGVIKEIYLKDKVGSFEELKIKAREEAKKIYLEETKDEVSVLAIGPQPKKQGRPKKK